MYVVFTLFGVLESGQWSHGMARRRQSDVVSRDYWVQCRLTASINGPGIRHGAHVDKHMAHATFLLGACAVGIQLQ